MPNTFKLKVANNVTSVTTVYTAPGSTTSTIVGLIIANDAAVDTFVTVEVTDSSAAVTVKLCSDAPLPAASNLPVLNNNNRLVLETGDSIKVTADDACDVTVSIMEITA
jgi:hypothetical protein